MALVRRHRYASVAGLLVIVLVGGTLGYGVFGREGAVTVPDGPADTGLIAAGDATQLSFRGTAVPLDGEGSVQVNEGVPALVTGVTADGVGREAIMIRWPGTEAVPVELSPENTAFAFLVAAPPLLTADPGALLVARALATRSSNFPELVDAVTVGDDARAVAARDAVAYDVLTSASALAQQMGADALTSLEPDVLAGGGGGGMGMSVPMAATSGDGLECPTGEPTAQSGLCITAGGAYVEASTAPVRLDIVNRSRGWQGVFEVDSDGHISRIAALVPPRRMSAMDGGTEVATNYLKYVGTQMVDSIGDWTSDAVAGMCGTTAGDFFYDVATALPHFGSGLLGWFGVKSEVPDCQQFADSGATVIKEAATTVVDVGIGRVDEAVWDPEGETTSYVYPDAPLASTVAITGTWGPSSSDYLDESDEGQARALLALMNGWTTFVEPAWSLAMGVSTSDLAESETQDNGGDDRDGALRSLLDAVVASPAFSDILRIQEALRNDDIKGAQVAALEAWTTISLDKQLFQQVGEALVGKAFSKLATELKGAISDMVSKRVGRSNPVVLAVTTAADLIYGVPAIAEQQHRFLEESRLVPSSVDMPPLWWYVARTDHKAILALNHSILASLTVDQIVLTNPDPSTLSWTGDFYQADYSFLPESEELPLRTTGRRPAFWPNYGYPGSEDYYWEDGAFITNVQESAQPWLPSGPGVRLSEGRGSGDPSQGKTMQFHAVPGAFATYTTADGEEGAWLVASWLTDAHSQEPRWAMCRFHIEVRDLTPQVDGIYCDDAENGGRAGLHPYFQYVWAITEDGALIESREGTIEYPDLTLIEFRVFSKGPGKGVLGIERYASGDEAADSLADSLGVPLATWHPSDDGIEFSDYEDYERVCYDGDQYVCRGDI